MRSETENLKQPIAREQGIYISIYIYICERKTETVNDRGESSAYQSAILCSSPTKFLLENRGPCREGREQCRRRANDDQPCRKGEGVGSRSRGKRGRERRAQWEMVLGFQGGASGFRQRRKLQLQRIAAAVRSDHESTTQRVQFHFTRIFGEASMQRSVH